MVPPLFGVQIRGVSGRSDSTKAGEDSDDRRCPGNGLTMAANPVADVNMLISKS